MRTADERVQALLRKGRPARSRDFVAAGIPRTHLSRMVAAGRLVRLARGLYAAPGYQPGEHASLIEVARRAPKAVFCLLTALRLHELTTQAPFEIWIAIGNKEHPPRLDYPKLRVVRFSGPALTEGVQVRRIDGTNVAKTVADCFKFRNKIGLDVALEALREALRVKKATVDELWRYARIDRVANVMRPYLEVVA
jgi:predicted transcriptional regulator of viral defense system